ncbi:hypothetical protein BH10PSE14_BH10PSE14_04190 [soil metagenome]
MLWKLLAGASALALAAFLVVIYGNARAHGGALEERGKWQAEQLVAANRNADTRVADAQRVTAAVADYADRAAALQPIILRSHDMVTTYAQTPAGTARCLSPDRVLGLDAYDHALFPAAAPTAEAAAGQVHPDAGTPPG